MDSYKGVDRDSLRSFFGSTGITIADLARKSGIKYRKLSGYFCSYWGMKESDFVAVWEALKDLKGVYPDVGLREEDADISEYLKRGAVQKGEVENEAVH